MQNRKLSTRCALLFIFFFITSFASLFNFQLCCCGNSRGLSKNISNTPFELQNDINTEMIIHPIRREEKPEIKFVTKTIILNPGKIGIILDISGLITEIEDDAQPSILNNLKMPGWTISKIDRKIFSEKLLMRKKYGLEEYEVIVQREERKFQCGICFDDYSEFDFYKYIDKDCGHMCCLKCFFLNWKIGRNGRRCWSCRKNLTHVLLIAVDSGNLQHVKVVIEEGEPHFNFEWFYLVHEALKISRRNQCENITEFLKLFASETLPPIGFVPISIQFRERYLMDLNYTVFYLVGRFQSGLYSI